MNIEKRANEMKKGLWFFDRVVAVVTLIAVVMTISAVWRAGTGFSFLWRDTEGVFWSALWTVITALMFAGPYWLLAWGLRHVRNLFFAMNNALDELRTTV